MSDISGKTFNLISREEIKAWAKLYGFMRKLKDVQKIKSMAHSTNEFMIRDTFYDIKENNSH